MKYKLIPLLSVVVLMLSCQKQEKLQTTPKNIILMISDGCGENHILATNYFMDGEAVSQPYQEFDVNIFMSTYPAITSKVYDNNKLEYYHSGYNSGLAWSDTNYINQSYTGSAAAATAMYTGVKTAQHAIGVGIDSTPLRSIADRAYELGKSLGVVSSVPLSHATPASLGAHNTSRQRYSEIANEMIIDSRLSVILGCGHPYYNNNAELSDTVIDANYVGGIGTWNNLIKGSRVYDSTTIYGNNKVQDIDGDGMADPWTLITDSIDFVNLASGQTPKRLFGVPKVNASLQVGRKMNSRSGSTLPFEIAFNRNIPTLEDMTKAALNVLDNNKNGFLVMIEGGAIDWAGHANAIERVIEEEDDFNNSVRAVIEWIEENSSWEETLLIVTGDHETGYLAGPDYPGSDLPKNFRVINNGKGNIPSHQFRSGSHTNQLIPFFAKGAGSEKYLRLADETDYFRGPYINNTEIAQNIFYLWDAYSDMKPELDTSRVAK